jgi:asparagine synthase (glutamine-hydrolysing)
MKGNSSANSKELIQAMNSRIAHRGPDNDGVWSSKDDQLFLGHRRLSIIDLSPSGNQPMIDEQGNAIVFNGEIYNYKEIKAELGNTRPFKTGSDTEVILELYKTHGHSALKKLNGMFAFAYWNQHTETLYLARDRAGKKPLYYTLHDGKFAFSSEIKALLTLPWVKAKPDQEALYHFLTYNQLPAPLTMFEGIHKLDAGECMTIHKGHIKIEKYWSIDPQNFENKSEQEISDELFHQLEKSVDYRMVADVPVGSFLSGGVDSSAVVALMRAQSNATIKTFSVGFDGQGSYDERVYADKVAKMFKTEHFEKNIRPEDISNSLPLIIDSFDEPMADATCIPIYFISQLARENGTIVVQTGDGADELFSGYRAWMKYQKVYPWYHLYNKFPSVIKKGMAGLVNETNDEASAIREIFSRAAQGQELFWGGAKAFKESTKRSFLTAAYLKDIGNTNSYSIIQKYKQEFTQLKATHPWLTDTDWMCYLGLRFQIPSKYLYRMDKLGMANSIEIRNPFLDYNVINTAFSIPARYKTKNQEPKYILKKSLERILPNEILYRKKMGFCVPLQEWAGEIMLDYTEQNLKSFTRNTELFTEAGLKEQIQAIRNGNKAYTNQLWTIYFLMAWFKKWMSA